MIELRWLYDRRNAEEARRDLAAWLLRWQEKYPRLCAWVEENIEETLTFYRLPREHHKHLKSTNMVGAAQSRDQAPHTGDFASFPTKRARCGSFELSLLKSTRTGSKPTVTSTWRCCANSAKNSNSWRPPKVNTTASSQTGCSDLASAPELSPCGARAAATSPPAFMNKPHPFSQLFPDLLLLNLTHTTTSFSCYRPSSAYSKGSESSPTTGAAPADALGRSQLPANVLRDPNLVAGRRPNSSWGCAPGRALTSRRCADRRRRGRSGWT